MFKIALATALVLGFACAGAATAKDRAQHQRSTFEWQAPTSAYGSDVGSASSEGVREPAYMAIQTRGDRENN